MALLSADRGQVSVGGTSFVLALLFALALKAGSINERLIRRLSLLPDAPPVHAGGANSVLPT